MFPLGIPYGKELESGMWGKPTSTIDWCEENYVVTYYLAEAVNTVTNAGFILLAGQALLNCHKNRMEKRFIWSCLGFMLVGVGSWLFHMTLKYHFQLLDELPMIYATCIPLWSSFTHNKSKRFENIFASLIVSGALALTLIYMVFKNPMIHETAYALLNFFIILKNMSVVYNTIDDKLALYNLRWTLIIGLGEFLFGWFLWNMDIRYCSMWRSWRHYIGLPLGLLLEGHGWWHVFTGFGIYVYIVHLQYLRIFQLHRERDYVFFWKYRIFPVIELTPEAKKRIQI